LPHSTTLTTNAGGPYTLGVGGTVALSDIAHLAGGTSNATGTITFKLFSDASCQTQVGSSVTATVTDASGVDYTSPTITVSAAGTYHWIASYVSGDGNNSDATTACCPTRHSSDLLPHSTTLTTNAGGPYTLGVGG